METRAARVYWRVPRHPIRLIRKFDSDEIRCVSAVNANQDVTKELMQVANEQTDQQLDLCGYILKSASPSCGMERVKVHSNSGVPIKDGSGIYAAALMKNFPCFPLEEEGRLGDPKLRENFIQRVYIMWRWKQLLTEGITARKLVEFRSRHNLILMSHSQEGYRKLGQLVAEIQKGKLLKKLMIYIESLMSVLKIVATVRNHLNTLVRWSNRSVQPS